MKQTNFKSQADVFLERNNFQVEEITPETPTAQQQIKTSKIELETKEPKSKKVLIAIQPSLYDLVKKQAKLNKLSLNETFCQLLQRALKP